MIEGVNDNPTRCLLATTFCWRPCLHLLSRISWYATFINLIARFRVTTLEKITSRPPSRLLNTPLLNHGAKNVEIPY